MVPVRGLFVEETAHPVSAGAASPDAAGGRGWAANQNCSPWVLGAGRLRGRVGSLDPPEASVLGMSVPWSLLPGGHPDSHILTPSVVMPTGTGVRSPSVSIGGHNVALHFDTCPLRLQASRA